MQQMYGTEKIIALLGNHEKDFLNFLYDGWDEWLDADVNLNTTKTFVTMEQVECMKEFILKGQLKETYSRIRKYILENHKELIQWMKKLPYFYKKESQIFVHAGVDEVAGDWWELGTEDDYFIQKYPAVTGDFYMDIIAGHVSTAAVSGNRNYHDVYYDGMSHYYIDGGVAFSGHIPILGYDKIKRKYYSVGKDGKLKCLN